MIGFFEAERWAFFGLSLSIIVLALSSYTLAFVLRYVEPHSLCELIGAFLTILPLSPFCPFFFYFADKRSSLWVKLLEQCCWFAVWVDDMSASESKSKLRKFMMDKIAKHMGFILEALVEGMYSINI